MNPHESMYRFCRYLVIRQPRKGIKIKRWRTESYPSEWFIFKA